VVIAMNKVMTDPEYTAFLIKLRRLFIDEQPPHEFALRAATRMAVGVAVAELKMDAAETKAWFSQNVDEFITALEAYHQKRQN
jgi:hypothetical protein